MWRVRPALVVIDPVSAVLGSVDSHKDAAVRGVLAPLAKLAEDADTSICSLPTPTRRSPATPSAGSAARSHSAAHRETPSSSARDPNNTESDTRRLLAHFKSNTGRLAPTLEYEIRSVFLPADDGQPETDTARLELVGESAMTSNDLLTVVDGDERTETDEAVDILRAELADGPRPARDVEAVATRSGIGRKALRRARDRLGVKPERTGSGPGGVWHWTLPASIDAPATPLMPLQIEGHLCD